MSISTFVVPLSCREYEFAFYTQKVTFTLFGGQKVSPYHAIDSKPRSIEYFPDVDAEKRDRRV